MNAPNGISSTMMFVRRQLSFIPIEEFTLSGYGTGADVDRAGG